MTIRFVNRVEELGRLAEAGRVTVIFGRRRVGKTALVKCFSRDKNALYLLSINKPLTFNFQRFSQVISELFNLPGIRFTNVREMFQFLEKQDIDLIIIDEFGYLIEHGILPEFQEIVDDVLTKKLILTGSSISLMETEVLKYKSPIYGRVDTIMHLLPLRFSHILEWFKGKDFEDIFKIYAAVGGTPRYLEFFQAVRADEEIRQQLFTQSFLFYDCRKILEEELREPVRYFMILEAIAKGKNTLNEIKNFADMESNKIPFYLNKLKRLKIISPRQPLISPKRSFYAINDNYFRFWFRFIYPYEDEIDSLMGEHARYEFNKWFNTYLGYIFEDICREVIRETFKFPKIGTQYGPIPKSMRKNTTENSYEIDIAAINDEGEILFGECKWSLRIDAERIVKKLAERASYVLWKNDKRKEVYVIFARSFYKKIAEWNGKKVYCFDLPDIEKILMNKH